MLEPEGRGRRQAAIAAALSPVVLARGAAAGILAALGEAGVLLATTSPASASASRWPAAALLATWFLARFGAGLVLWSGGSALLALFRPPDGEPDPRAGGLWRKECAAARVSPRTPGDGAAPARGTLPAFPGHPAVPLASTVLLYLAALAGVAADVRTRFHNMTLTATLFLVLASLLAIPAAAVFRACRNAAARGPGLAAAATGLTAAAGLSAFVGVALRDFSRRDLGVLLAWAVAAVTAATLPLPSALVARKRNDPDGR